MTGGSGSIAVTILDNRIDENNETIVLNLPEFWIRGQRETAPALAWGFGKGVFKFR